MNEYSQGICEDGAAILKNGHIMTIEEILAELRERDQLKADIEKLTRRNASIIEEAEREARYSRELRITRFREFNNEDCWIYCGDSHDNLESLVCPVVMQPQQLIEILQDRDQLKDQLYKYSCEDVDVIRCLKTLAYEHNHSDIPRYRELAKKTMDKYVKRCSSVGFTTAEHDAQVIEQFKNELVRSVNVVFRPHIEGVCAVVQSQLRQKPQEAE